MVILPDVQPEKEKYLGFGRRTADKSGRITSLISINPKSATLKEQLERVGIGNMSQEYEEMEDDDYESDFEESASDVSDEEDF